MAVYKHCEKKFNPFLGCSTIQLGTLDYYRTVDDPFIRDVKELELSRVLNAGSGMSITGDALGALTNLPIGGIGSIQFSGAAIKSTFNIHNIYVFCTSLSATNNSFSTYDSSYHIVNPQGFCEFLAHKLHLHLKQRIVGYHGAIRYMTEKQIEHTDWSFFSKTIEISDYLVKTRLVSENNSINYSANAEYRFVFIPVNSDNTIVPIDSTPVLIDKTGIEQYIQLVD